MIDFQEIKTAARGRWSELLPALAGVAPEVLDGKHHPCPKCGGTDRFRFSDLDGDGAVICNNCGRTGDGIATMAKLLDISQGEAARRVAAAVGVNGHADVGDVLEAVARAKGLTPEDLAAYGAVVAGDHIEVPAFGPDGSRCSEFSVWPTGSDRQRKGLSAKGKPAGLFLPVVDGSPRLPAAGETWLLVEGCKDAAALKGLGFLAVGMPTCQLAQKFVPMLRGVHAVVVPDRDAAGTDGAEKTAARLHGVAESIRVAALPSELKESDGADVRDILRRPGGESELREAIENAKPWKPPGQGGFSAGGDRESTSDAEALEAVDDPHRLARLLVDAWRTPEGEATLVFWRDEWHRWDGSAYRTVPVGEVRGSITQLSKREFDRVAARMLEAYRRREAAGELKPNEKPPKAIKVTRAMVSNVVQAIEAECLLASTIERPSWLEGEGPFPADEILPHAGGLLHIPSLVDGRPCEAPLTPQFFASHGIPYSFDPTASCPKWVAFLKELWPDDPESIEALRQWFGYLLTPDTRRHKMAMLVGPTRCGKGTIGRILLAMLGEANCAAPKLSSLATSFGLWPLVGKPAALVADARLSGRMDGVAILETLLSITGEDAQDIHRKNLPAVTGIKLPTRFTVLTNELPDMKDASGAFSARVLLLKLTEDFLGREDEALTDRLKTELPGILNWAIRGWESLRSRGRFIQPASGAAMLDALRDIGSPVGQFVRERCEVGAGFTVSVPELFGEWKEWCQAAGRDKPGTIQTFGKQLSSVCPRVGIAQPRTAEGSRTRCYEGIRVRNPF